MEQAVIEARTEASLRLKDQVAIITGGAQGIGRATAELFAREGARVVLADMDGTLAEKTAAELREATGRETLGVAADVRSLEDCEKAVKLALDKLGRIDILVNNAGLTRDKLLMQLSEEDWDLVLDVNLKGAFNFTRAVIRPMMKARRGRVVNIASVVGQMGNVGQANYAASKGGIIALTKAMAKEFASRNVLVNAIAPGFIKTRLTDVLPEDAKSKLYQMIPLGRFGEPADIAKAILFLVSEESSYITGQVLGVNGGMYM